MGSKGVVLAKGLKCFGFFPNQTFNLTTLKTPHRNSIRRNFSASLQPPDVEEFAPQIRRVIDWFGQLQAVDLESVEPAIRADTEGDNLRDDVPETFENREAMIAGVPKYEEPYIKVPIVLNKE
ncbi:hypothetical protein TIFTF001_009259 [Ficus carica]|uniref:Glutamyl-tRNA(Gln) amidotransferase subunit C, chloroplastic/mitochondrial n=1 Tax=Ficus carica TaxID=3494 RepID=A0AA88D3G4_FICCA|nr:hypothetical protein TIFTF001_009259 [Ficus carica]